jgi:hypothetical protein
LGCWWHTVGVTVLLGRERVMAGDGTENWRLILEAARALTAAGQSPFTRVSVYEWIWRRYPRSVHDRPSLDPVFQGMVGNAPGGPASAAGTPLARVGRGEYVLVGASVVSGGASAGPSSVQLLPAPGQGGVLDVAEEEASVGAEEVARAAGNLLTSGLDAFAEQFRAQADSAGLPSSEHAVHFCLALGLQSAWALPAGAIVFERPSRSGTRTDLWVGEPHDLTIEVKYLRSHSSGSQPARPMHYGQLLADFNKVAQLPGRLRLVVLAADEGYMRYVVQSGNSVLPLKVGETALITLLSLDRLADTPRQKAESHGPWRDLRTRLRWTSKVRDCSLFAWEVTPGTGPSQTAADQHG